MPKLPIKFPSTRIKSPAPRPRPRPTRSSPPPPSSRRSRSHDADHHPESSSTSRHPHSARRQSRARSPDPEERQSSRDDRSGRHRRRRDSSSSSGRHELSPRRVDRDYLRDDRGRRRHSSQAPDKDDRPSSARYPSPPRMGMKPVAAYGVTRDARGDERRSSTPDKYKPDRYKEKERDTLSPDRHSSRPVSSDASAPSKPKPEAAGAKGEATPAASEGSSAGMSSLLSHMPKTLATYAGIKMVTKHADTAKEWISWLNDLDETPEEIQEMSAKATTARDTINQVQQTLKARPDLLEGETGEQLKEQIEESIRSTDKALGKMTKLLSEISKKGASHGNVIDGMQDYWRSYRYKEEFQGKVEEANDGLQKELTGLSTLMVNLYSRSMMKPAPPGSAEVPPPVPTKEVVQEARVPKATDQSGSQAKEETYEDLHTHPATIRTPAESKRPSVPTIVEPERQTKDDSSTAGSDEPIRPPVSPSTLALEEAAVGSPPPSSPREETKKVVGDLPTPPPTASKDKDRPLKEAREMISEEQAQDDLLDAAWDGDLDGAARALRYVSYSCCDIRGLTPLHLAAERDHLAVAILLLDRGADVQGRSDGGRTPLHLAARSASASMVEMLLERAKADPNAQTAKGRTPLHYAASKATDGDEERREVIRVLRDWGADPTVADKDGQTARDVAQERGHWDAASTLRRAEKKWEEEHKQSWLQRHGFTK